MPGKTPKSNGNEPIENGIRSNGDIDMKDAGKTKGKKGVKDGDEEMTVVVPPSKGSKHSKQPHDADGDVSMGGDDKADVEDKVDPVVQTVAGTFWKEEQPPIQHDPLVQGSDMPEHLYVSLS
jgi:26S proteasome regulatory subunit N3